MRQLRRGSHTDVSKHEEIPSAARGPRTLHWRYGMCASPREMAWITWPNAVRLLLTWHASCSNQYHTHTTHTTHTTSTTHTRCQSES